MWLILLLLLPSVVSPFVGQCDVPRRLPSSSRGISTFASPSSTAPVTVYPDEAIVAENIKAHMETIRQSEETFYGYYPEGFTEFDSEKAPSAWTAYSLSSDDIQEEQSLDALSLQSFNIWDTFSKLDERIIPPPFTSDELARVSETSILSAEECTDIINECESHYWGWGSSNERYGTPSNRVGYMLKLEDLSRSYSLVNFELLPRLFPAIMNAFPDLPTSPENLRLGGCRVVKYDASEGRVELGLHRDGLLVTANIALNDSDEYEGGGTYVEGLPSFMKNPIRLPKSGHVLLHPGDVRHGGAPITKGVRYVLVCFITDKSIVPHEKYCQDRMKRDVEAARAIPSIDESRMEEKSLLFASATKHCADAYAFGRLSCSGELCDGYDEIVKAFDKLSKNTHYDDSASKHVPIS
jgi:predicted 2-oxoglutarate/Fe(II)-dependent dioxygenase YbiX